MQRRSALSVNRAVVFALLLREMRTRFGMRRMGAFWILFEPIIHIVAIMLVITVLRGRQLTGFDYPLFVLVGMVPYFLTRNIAIKLMDSVSANRSLFAYPNIRIFDTYVARTLVESALYACVFVIIMLGMWWFLDYDVTIRNPLAFFAILLVGIGMSFGIGLILSVIVEAMPNSRMFVRFLFMPLYFLSCVLVPVWIIPRDLLHWALWNPWLHVLDGLRRSYFDNYPVTAGIGMYYPTIFTVVVIFVGMALYHLRKRELLAI
ncbi:ABC transporter permease [Bordetella hinzii]|nr:ABC transporter permease [Bordetella hinzii]QDJ42010.1 sugar ABC transporter permease [Bordetella hinzii]